MDYLGEAPAMTAEQVKVNLHVPLYFLPLFLLKVLSSLGSSGEGERGAEDLEEFFLYHSKAFNANDASLYHRKPGPQPLLNLLFFRP